MGQNELLSMIFLNNSSRIVFDFDDRIGGAETVKYLMRTFRPDAMHAGNVATSIYDPVLLYASISLFIVESSCGDDVAEFRLYPHPQASLRFLALPMPRSMVYQVIRLDAAICRYNLRKFECS